MIDKAKGVNWRETIYAVHYHIISSKEPVVVGGIKQIVP